jgi:acyl-CoA reductase-like NAD-dependent aldehyde dehydrogenase
MSLSITMVSKDINQQFEDLKLMAESVDELDNDIEHLIDLKVKANSKPVAEALNRAIGLMIHHRDFLVEEIDKKY